MDKKKIMTLIKKEENLKLDFKIKLGLETESEKKELARDVCAIANSRGGRGYILIGIEDKTKRIVGMDDQIVISEEQIQQIITTRCEPPIPISFEEVEVGDKKIGVLSIYDSYQKPFQLRENGSFYIRRGSTTDTMRKQELITSFQENLNLNVEICTMIRSGIQDIDKELVEKYLKSKGYLVDNENMVDLMENIGIITKDREFNEYHATLGGLLLFCNYNSVYLPHNMVIINNKVSKEVRKIQGSLMNMIDESELVLKEMLPSNYPYEAIFEGVKNAILYRDYSIFYKEIEVIIDKNSIAVISPGNLITQNRDEGKFSNYFKRNMWLYEKLITLDDKNRFLRSDKGFTRMRNAFKNMGKVIFINSIEHEYFKVIYPGISKFLKNKIVK